MEFSSKVLAILTSSLGLLSINFAVSLPAQASIVCDTGTISQYQNGSLQTCILGQNTNMQVTSQSFGSLYFECQAKKYISFYEKGQFESCWLEQEIQIRQDNSTQTCPAEYKLDVSVSTDDIIQSVSCSPY